MSLSIFFSCLEGKKKDRNGPIITVIGGDLIYWDTGVGNNYLDHGITVEDNFDVFEDLDVSAYILNGAIQHGDALPSVGTYSVLYQVVDSDLNQEHAARTVVVTGQKKLKIQKKNFFLPQEVVNFACIFTASTVLAIFLKFNCI